MKSEASIALVLFTAGIISNTTDFSSILLSCIHTMPQYAEYSKGIGNTARGNKHKGRLHNSASGRPWMQVRPWLFLDCRNKKSRDRNASR